MENNNEEDRNNNSQKTEELLKKSEGLREQSNKINIRWQELAKKANYAIHLTNNNGKTDEIL